MTGEPLTGDLMPAVAGLRAKPRPLMSAQSQPGSRVPNDRRVPDRGLRWTFAEILAFAKAYAEMGSGTAAYLVVRPGGSDTTAKRQASHLLKRDDVREAVSLARLARAAQMAGVTLDGATSDGQQTVTDVRAPVTVQEVRANLRAELERVRSDAARAKLLDMAAKMAGAYAPEKHEVTHHAGWFASLDLDAEGTDANLAEDDGGP